MKIIELLNKIANGEEVPKKIKYDGQEYKITKVLLEDNNYYFNYINEDMECIFPINTNILNDTLEILEEEKKIPEKLSNIKFENGKFYLPVGNKHNYIIREVDKVFLDKINKIIDYLKSKGE